ncbi:hypothetical protein AAFF_G00309440 [Aldrovandia affinis]|uniref:Uncharacterized protein n=1 Tax=Aldrovandia affinis TaxID=143900 RepID=A0AAD7SQU0_9TELE|nr:hypothetical protein AAFF_G00309440 [Aldrovandia affinis]
MWRDRESQCDTDKPFLLCRALGLLVRAPAPSSAESRRRAQLSPREVFILPPLLPRRVLDGRATAELRVTFCRRCLEVAVKLRGVGGGGSSLARGDSPQLRLSASAAALTPDEPHLTDYHAADTESRDDHQSFSRENLWKKELRYNACLSGSELKAGAGVTATPLSGEARKQFETGIRAEVTECQVGTEGEGAWRGCSRAINTDHKPR